MMSAPEESIHITHFVNPHMFWFKYESLPCNIELFTWENDLQAHFFKLTKSPISSYQPQTNETVAVFIFSMFKWIRAKCDDCVSENTYSVWAIDYGVPYQLEDKWIRPMPKELEAGPKPSVCFAGLMNIVPAERMLDPETLECDIVTSDHWSSSTIQNIQNLIKASTKIHFHKKHEANEQLFGQLVLTTKTGKSLNVEDTLIKLEKAKIVSKLEFLEFLNVNRTNKSIRWFTPSDDGTPKSLKATANAKLRDEFSVKSPPDNKLVPSCVDRDVVGVEQKCTEWAQRNQQYPIDGEISIDEIAIMESASVANLQIENPKELVSQKDIDLDPPIMMKGDLMRRQYNRNYKNGIPRPPSEKIDSSKNSLSSSSEKDKCDNNGDNSKDEVLNSQLASLSVKGVSPTALNAHAIRLLNKRKAVLAKLSENTLNSSSPVSENIDATIQQISVSNTGKSDHGKSNNESVEGVSQPALNAYEIRLANKRKAVLAKLNESKLNSSLPVSENIDPTTQSISVSNTSKSDHDKSDESIEKNIETPPKDEISKMSEPHLDEQEEPPKDRYAKYSQNKIVLPAGIDMCVLNKPKPRNSGGDRKNFTSKKSSGSSPLKSESQHNTSVDISDFLDSEPKSNVSGGSRKSNNSKHSSGSGRRECRQSERSTSTPVGGDIKDSFEKPKSSSSGDGRKSNSSRHSSGSGNQSAALRDPDNISNNVQKCGEGQNDLIKRKSDYRLKRYDTNKINLNDLDETCLQTNLSKHLVLVHGKHIAKPIDKLVNANFCDEVHQELEHMRLTQLYRIQSYTWPHIMRGNSAVIVSSARSGRTMSYLPAICSLVKMASDEGLVPDTVGPIGIIIAPSSLEVERISKLCRRFLHGSPTKIAIVESYGIRNMEKTTNYLLNGCEVLVTTLCSLSRLIKHKFKMFDSKRIKHLVIDNIDLMHDEMKSQLHEVLRFCCGTKSTTSIQLIVIAKYWNAILSGFIKMGQNTLLCIGAYIEAAVYARSLINIKFMKKTSKTLEIMDFIKNHPYLLERLIIICNKEDEVDEVVEALKSNSCFHVACSSRSTAEELELTKKWHDSRPGDMCILVCTDDVLPDIKACNAQNIIHYSLPQSWTRFSFRFSTLFGYIDDLVKLNVPTKTPPSISILLDENNNTQLPKLMHFLEVHHVESIPEEIYGLCNRIKIQREEERISENREFCTYMMEFGRCFNISDCPNRHELTKYDIPDENLLVSGNISFKVLSIISPTHYTVRLLEHQPVGSKTWNKVRSSNEYLKFNLKFAQYYSDEDNRQMHWPIRVNDLCVVSEGEVYHRAKVLYVSKCKSVNLIMDVTCRVKLVDVGRVIACKSSRVLLLPEEFQHLPHQAVNLRLSGVVPYDYEYDWSNNAIVTVQHWFEKYLTDKVTVMAKIKFSLMDMIWVENIKLVSQLESIHTYVTEVNIKKSLLEKQFASINNDAEVVLKEKATACGIFKDGHLAVSKENTENDICAEKNAKNSSISSASSHAVSDKIPLKENLNNSINSGRGVRSKRIIKQEVVTEKTTNVDGKWENLPENEFSRILIGAFYTPNHFYVQRLNDLDGKEKLYNAIDKFAAEHPVVVKHPEIGLNCLAEYDGKFNRAKIVKLLFDGENNEVAVSLFFCDIGLSATVKLSQVIHSNHRLVTMLPFQAIRCRLTGIVPKTYGLWTEDVCDEIYDNILDPAQFVYARSVLCEMPHEKSDCKYWRCDVVLLDCTTEEDVKINDRIVEMGYADYDPETQHFLSIVPNLPAYDADDDNDSTDSNWDKCDWVNPFKLQPSNYDDNDFNSLGIDVDIQFTQEDILQMLNLPPTAKIIQPEEHQSSTAHPPAIIEELSADDDQAECSVSKKPASKKISHSAKSKPPTNDTDEIDETDYSQMMPLKSLFKSPQVMWQQSQSLILLRISAPDVDDYYLKVTSTNLVFIANIESTTKVLLINFLGCIDPSLVSHEIRGLKVIVRLPKAIKGILWPRLLWESDKPQWLKYNYESIRIENETLMNTGRFRQNTPHCANVSDTDSSSDNQDNYPTLYKNDDFDPFDDDFANL